MPVFRTILVVVSIFLAVLYVYDACHSYTFAAPASNVVASRWPDPDEFRPTAAPASAPANGPTPAARVRETFAMFLPGDGRRHTNQRSL